MNYSGWIIYNKEDAQSNKSYIDWFIDQCRKRHIQLQLVYREDLSIGIFNHQTEVKQNGQTPISPDFVIVRVVEPTLNLHFEMMGIQVFNSFLVSHICNNKALTHMHLSMLQIPMLDSVFAPKTLLDEELPATVPFIIKSVSGRGGRQVALIEQQSDMEKYMKETDGQEFVVQPVNVQAGKDLRVFIVGKEIVGAVLRENKSDFRANYKLGGSATWYSLTKPEIQMIRKIVDHFEFGMVGIDFLFDKDGNLLFNEIEDVVGSRTLSKVSSVNILEKYVQYIEEKLKQKER
ncbi:ATP-grasp domain-containing protein [Sediminibacillus massiliensis]|uniref:ATP-grasp domain-containing protein n=1 Tax=Sediminibacillus massiliensis TaxID=1926277 RepID=UPI0009886426|nr:ATP-grasp domain-containing protein [Sediminibacillus massiliensis]